MALSEIAFAPAAVPGLLFAVPRPIAFTVMGGGRAWRGPGAARMIIE